MFFFIPTVARWACWQTCDARKLARDTQAKKEPANGKGDKKWDTLEHHGVVFPPEYEPHGVPLVYDGEEVQLTPAQVRHSGAAVCGHAPPAGGAKMVGARRTGC